ncbi:MAG: 3-isopropylmalate dehydrogenase [Myxococcales bacterium]|nr:isocitrate/isopropylmalate dehydrogenase family protein [Sorangiineae bacterium PRO1]MCL4750534.1 3-isopropylmalate dehydrogenase [Myxococcales bacterium]
MPNKKKIAIIGGDGIGPEVTREATRLLERYAGRGLPIDLWQLDLGAERFLRDGTTMPKEIFIAIQRECSAVLLGALGDPRVPTMEHARDILFGLRFGLDLYANIRPVKALSDRLVPLKGRGKKDVDFVVFRENTEGVYVGVGGQVKRGTPDEIAINEDVNTRKGVERIIRAAFEFAKAQGRKRVHMADKSNAMRHAHELWLRVFDEVRREFPEIQATHVYIDALCLYMVQDPSQFDVVVTNNLFGDIVTDLGAAFQGGLGMAASANVHPAVPGKVGLFEPVHGSAPPLAGKNLANPFAALLTVGMLLAHLGWPEEEQRIEEAVADALEAGKCTKDVGGSLSTEESAAAVLERLGAS